MIMNATDWNTALFEKMSDEQDNYRDWLKSQPPEEILHHTYEYTVREDIMMTMEELELTDTQAQALLESPSPLADVYRYFEKLETGYMDVIRDSIENRADDVCRAQEELRTAPLYPHSAAYASEYGEMAQYRNPDHSAASREFRPHGAKGSCSCAPPDAGRGSRWSARLPAWFSRPRWCVPRC